jgi:Alpha-tubulin suppressor and related RCC1 domain-containing proteins
MSRSIWFRSITVIVLTALFYLFLSCVSVPENPYNPSNAKIWLTLKSASGRVNVDSLTDSVGNIVTIGITANLPEYIDSIGISVYSSPDGNFDVDTVLKKLTPLQNRDTLWYKAAFATSGRKTLTATVFASAFKNPTVAYLNIFDRPIKSVPHTWPHIIITGTKNITVAQTCSLSVTANDSNAGQLHSFYVKQDTLPFAQFTPPFRWIPSTGFTGAHQVLFKVMDTDSPAYFDTQTVTITVSDTAKTAPHWNKDSVNLNGAEGSTISLTLSDIVSGDSLSFILIPGLPAKDTIINAVYSYAFAAFDTNNYYPKIIAKDKKDNGDTMTVHLWASRTNIDSIPPIVKHLTPLTDSITVSTNSFKASVICKDSSGIASVKCSSGTDTFATSRADSVWSATITGLVQGQYKTVTFLATDMAARANKTALNVYIKYDSTMTDTLPPAITLVNPSKDTIINTDSSLVRVKCTDASGISSVIYSIGTQKFTASRSTPTDSIFTGTVKGLALGAYSTITITATDASTARNTATATVKIKYDNDRIKPTINLFDPAKDSLPINANSYAVKVVSKDSSGVVSVVYTFGTISFPATKTSDSVWTGTVSGLVSGALNKIIVVATDASVNSNKDTMTFFIKYDPTMTDLTGPVFFPKSGPANNAFVVDSIVNIIDSIFDPSGVDSVYWTQNGKNPKSLTLVSGSTYLYSLVDTLHRYHLDTIVITAQDKSTNRNKSNQTIILNYNVPPVINDTAISTNRNVAKTWTLNALSVDGDPLTWTRITSPSALSGTVTGTLPSVTFTPSINWSGVDSFKVQVTDGHWSDTTKIKLTVVNVNVAPSIITQPSSATKNVGQSVTFSVVINTDVNPAPSYVWKQNGNIITTATTSSYTIGSIAISDSGSYTVTIANSAGTITSQPVTLTVNYAPTIVTQPLSQTLYLGQSATFMVVATGNPIPTYQWRKNGSPINGATSAAYTLSSPGINDSGKYTVTLNNSVGSVISDTSKFYAGFKFISAGGSHSLILKTDGSMFSCGNNSNGQLGDGTTTDRHSPVRIMIGVQSVAAGGGHSLILKTDGTLLACGYNSDGELGDGTTTDQYSPVQVMTGVQSIAAGSMHSLILKTDGTLLACGSNYYGQLGDNSKINRNLPVPIMTNVQSIAAGGSHSLILKMDGTFFACGGNQYGQFGNGTTNSDSVPIQIVTGVQNIAAGDDHSLILKTGGTIFTCGYNLFGQLGDGTTTDRHSLVQIMTGVLSITANGSQSFILKTNGILLAFGANNYGQLGDGTTNNQNSPTQIITGVQSVAAGENHSFILMSNGTLYACGANSNGQLGDGTTTDKNSMVQIRF